MILVTVYMTGVTVYKQCNLMYSCTDVVVSFVVETSSPLLLQSNVHVLHVLIHVSSSVSTVLRNIENKLKIL